MARKTVDKGLLKNIIRHTDAHNKIQEQNEMWKQWELVKQSRKRAHSPLDEQKVRGYMRSDLKYGAPKPQDCLKWNKLLMEYEESCTDRWGHGGYKELYPEEFNDVKEKKISSNTSSDNEEQRDRKETSSSSKKKKKKKDKKKSRKEKESQPETDSDVSDSSYREKTLRRASKKPKKRNRTNEEKKSKRKRTK